MKFIKGDLIMEDKNPNNYSAYTRAGFVVFEADTFDSLKSLTRKEQFAKAKELGLKAKATMKEDELINLILEAK